LLNAVSDVKFNTYYYKAYVKLLYVNYLVINIVIRKKIGFFANEHIKKICNVIF